MGLELFNTSLYVYLFYINLCVFVYIERERIKRKGIKKKLWCQRTKQKSQNVFVACKVGYSWLHHHFKCCYCCRQHCWYVSWLPDAHFLSPTFQFSENVPCQDFDRLCQQYPFTPAWQCSLSTCQLSTEEKFEILCFLQFKYLEQHFITPAHVFIYKCTYTHVLLSRLTMTVTVFIAP